MSDEFSKDTENPLASISEIVLYDTICETEDAKGAHRITADLRCGFAEFSTDNTTFEVGVRSLVLGINTEGCEIVPGSRFNDEPKPSIEREREISTSKFDGTNIEGGGEASASWVNGLKLSGFLKGSKKHEASKSDQNSTSIKEPVHAVKAIGGQQWRVSDPLSEAAESGLNDTYLSNTPLFDVVLNPRSNYVEIGASIIIRQRDLIINPLETDTLLDKKNFDQNKAKFIGIVVGKAINKNSAMDGLDRPSNIVLLGKSILRSI